MVKQDGIREDFDNLERWNILELNINEYVVVSLTEDWENILKEHYLKLLKNFDYKKEGCSSLEEFVEKKYLAMYYKDGYCKILLRELMNIFWKYLSMGLKLPFKNNKIYFIEPNNEEAQKWAKKVPDEINRRLLDVLN